MIAALLLACFLADESPIPLVEIGGNCWTGPVGTRLDDLENREGFMMEGLRPYNGSQDWMSFAQSWAKKHPKAKIVRISAWIFESSAFSGMSTMY